MQDEFGRERAAPRLPANLATESIADGQLAFQIAESLLKLGAKFGHINVKAQLAQADRSRLLYDVQCQRNAID